MKLTVEQFVEWLELADGYFINDFDILRPSNFSTDIIDKDDMEEEVVAFNWIEDMQEYSIYLTHENIINGEFDTNDNVFRCFDSEDDDIEITCCRITKFLPKILTGGIFQ